MMIEDVMNALRTDHEAEVADLIDAAMADLELSGVHKSNIVTTDPLIKRAIITYCKANFGYEDPVMADRFYKSYEMLKTHLTLAGDYNGQKG